MLRVSRVALVYVITGYYQASLGCFVVQREDHGNLFPGENEQRQETGEWQKVDTYV